MTLPTQPRAEARRARERKIVDATRDLFDEQGMQDARIDRIARRVGINKALIYRHFASKEELFVLTVTRYLAEIDARLAASRSYAAGDELARLRRDAPQTQIGEGANDALLLALAGPLLKGD